MGQCLTGCHRLPVAVQSLELGGPGSPTARCSHSPCLYCQHLPAVILGELVLETSPKPASGHLAPLGCADRPLKADRLHSGLLDVVLSFVNPHWPIPITYLLSCASFLTFLKTGIKLSFSQSREASLSCSLSKAADSDWPPPLQVLRQTWLLASSTALYQYK